MIWADTFCPHLSQCLHDIDWIKHLESRMLPEDCETDRLTENIRWQCSQQETLG